MWWVAMASSMVWSIAARAVASNALLGCWVGGLRGCWVAGLPGCLVAWLLGCSVAGSLGRSLACGARGEGGDSNKCGGEEKGEVRAAHRNASVECPPSDNQDAAPCSR